MMETSVASRTTIGSGGGGSSTIDTTASVATSAGKTGNGVDDDFLGDGSFLPKSPRSSSIVGPSAEQALKELTVDKLRFESLGRLYGREKDMERLQEVFDASKASRNLCLVVGNAGVGKSALVNSLREKVRLSRGFFVLGKFEQQQNEQPYLAIASACRLFVEDLLLHRHGAGWQGWTFTYESFTEKLVETIHEDDLELLATVVPCLRLLLSDGDGDEKDVGGGYGDSDAPGTSSYTEVKIRIHQAFRQFIRLVGSFGQLVLLLDDLQWADSSSLYLLEALVTDRENRSLMLIGLYRDNEVEDTHVLSKLLREISCFDDPGLITSKIVVGNLDQPDVELMLKDLMSLSQEQAMELAELVHAKTAGNAFFVKQFLLSLHHNGLLSFNLGSMKWVFDLEKVAADSSSTENVVDLLRKKIKKLPKHLQSILPCVACLGYKFLDTSFELVAMRYRFGVSAESQECSSLDDADTPYRLLQSCKDEGLITECENGWHKWEHDKVQEAAFLSVDQEKLKPLKFSVGEFLMVNLSEEDLTSSLFTVTSLVNNGVDLVRPHYHRCLTIAKLNLRAGKEAFAASAFKPASSYLDVGILLLPPHKWECEFELALDMYSTAAEAQFCVGNFAKVKEYSDEILKLRNCPLLDKRRVYRATLNSLVAMHRNKDAQNLCLQILSKLGCHFPKHGRRIFAAAGVLRTAMSLRRALSVIPTLPAIEDENKRWVMSLLDLLVTYSWQGDPELLPLVMLKGYRWTLRYGISEYSGPVLANVAFLIVMAVGDFAGAKDISAHDALN